MSLLKRLFGKKKSEETQDQDDAPKVDEKKLDPPSQDRELNLDSVKAEVEAMQDDAKAEAVEQPVETEDKTLYHIKKHAKGWQIIADDAQRAYRVFDTQKAALDFAKAQELKFLLYRTDGTLRQ